jgi:hypothetical protein
MKTRIASDLLCYAIVSIAPGAQIINKRVAGRKVKIPRYITKLKSYSLAINNLLISSEKKTKADDLVSNIARSILAILVRKGVAYKKYMEYRKILDTTLFDKRFWKKRRSKVLIKSQIKRIVRARPLREKLEDRLQEISKKQLDNAHSEQNNTSFF